MTLTDAKKLEMKIRIKYNFQGDLLDFLMSYRYIDRDAWSSFCEENSELIIRLLKENNALVKTSFDTKESEFISIFVKNKVSINVPTNSSNLFRNISNRISEF